MKNIVIWLLLSGFCLAQHSKATQADITNSTIPTIAGAAAGSFGGALNPAACSEPSAPMWCSGSDMGAWINAAYAALPIHGGEVNIPAGHWNFATPIVVNTSHKPVRMHGAGSGATTLSYTAITGTAITIDTGLNNYVSELDRFTLIGPGVGTSTTGVSWGSVNGTVFAKAESVQVTAFGTGMTFPKPADFIWTGVQVGLTNNGQNLNDSSGGQENNSCYKCLFAVDTPGTTGRTTDSVQIGNSADWYFYGCSFDNVQLAVTTNATVRVFGGHFENPGKGSYDFFTASGNDLEFYGVNFLQGNRSNFPNNRFGSASSGIVELHGGSTFSPVTLGSFLSLSGTASAQNHGLILNSNFSSGWVTSTSRGYAAGYGMDASGDLSISGTAQAAQLRSNVIQMGTTKPALLCSSMNPSVSAGFNSGNVNSRSNGTCSFYVNVGNGLAGSTGTLSMPKAANGWNCPAPFNVTHPGAVIMETSTTSTSITITNYGTQPGTPVNWTNSDVIGISCFAH